MELESYLIAQEGWWSTDVREQRLDLLKQRKALVVITTSRDKYGGIDVAKYVRTYGFSGVMRIKLRMEEDPTCDDPGMARILGQVYDKCKDDRAFMGRELMKACDAQSKKTNKLVVLVYDYAPYYKEPTTQDHPCVIVHSNRVTTTLKEMLQEGHRLDVINKKYREHEYLRETIKDRDCIDHPEKLQLFHVSPVKPNALAILEPKIPQHPMNREYYGTARISAAPTIDQCFKAVGIRPENCPITYHVYQLNLAPTAKVIKPNKKLVPDVDRTQEHWVLTPTPTIHLGRIRVTYDQKQKIFRYEDHVDSKKIMGPLNPTPIFHQTEEKRI